jgi:hypothetical protein
MVWRVCSVVVLEAILFAGTRTLCRLLFGLLFPGASRLSRKDWGCWLMVAATVACAVTLQQSDRLG